MVALTPAADPADMQPAGSSQWTEEAEDGQETCECLTNIKSPHVAATAAAFAFAFAAVAAGVLLVSL